MALYSAEIVFRDGTRRDLTYSTVAYGAVTACIPNDTAHELAEADAPMVGVVGKNDVGFITFGLPDGRWVTVNLDTVHTMETWKPVSSMAQDKP